MAEPATRIWVADFSSAGKQWLAAASAHYVNGKASPMGYNYAAYAEPQGGSLSFDAMGQKTAATWPANCYPRGTAGAFGAAAVSQ